MQGFLVSCFNTSHEDCNGIPKFLLSGASSYQTLNGIDGRADLLQIRSVQIIDNPSLRIDGLLPQNYFNQGSMHKGILILLPKLSNISKSSKNIKVSKFHF